MCVFNSDSDRFSRFSPNNIAGWLLLLWLFLGRAAIAADSRPITVWLIPSEEAEARAAADTAHIAAEIRAFNQSLEGGPVRVLNTLPPLDQQLIVWNSEFAVPNWAWVKNQTETIKALQRFARLHNVKINVRFVTWDRAFANLNLPRTPNDANPPPDVVQIGTTWAAYFVSKRLIVSRPHEDGSNSNWKTVLGAPAVCLPYITDTRLLFYWKRLPTDEPSSTQLELKTANWEEMLNSLRTQGGPEDRFAFAGGLTLNLMFDYSMLEWAGGADPIIATGWRTHADFTSEKATKVPLELTEAASGKAGRRLIVVPESSHQALTQDFVVGQYRGIIEPANFISRWKKDFDKSFKGEKRFWDYAAAAVPPQPFKGGSYLAVMPSDDLSPEAFRLAEFLATDDDYTTVLARNAQLPALREQNGIDVLFNGLGGSDDAGARQFTKVLREATRTGRSLPDLPNFPTTIESTDVQEALQRMWRRIGDGDSGKLIEEAKSAEAILNLKIDRVARARNLLVESWWFGAILLLMFLTAAAILTKRNLARIKAALLEQKAASEREAAALLELRTLVEQVGKLRGFSAMALLSLARYHWALKAYAEFSEGDPDMMKRGIIAAGISGWRRGRNPNNWRPSTASEVVWRSILLGVDVTIAADVYEEWQRGCTKENIRPREFLEGKGILRPTEAAEDSNPTYFFDVSIEKDFQIQTPFLFEQAMASLIQNAIQASDDECKQRKERERSECFVSRKPICVSIATDRITIRNAGQAFPAEIRNLINGSRTPEQFEEAVLSAVKSRGGTKPGIGLTEAYTIANHFYGGLKIADQEASVSILLVSEEPAQ